MDIIGGILWIIWSFYVGRFLIDSLGMSVGWGVTLALLSPIIILSFVALVIIVLAKLIDGLRTLTMTEEERERRKKERRAEAVAGLFEKYRLLDSNLNGLFSDYQELAQKELDQHLEEIRLFIMPCEEPYKYRNNHYCRTLELQLTLDDWILKLIDSDFIVSCYKKDELDFWVCNLEFPIFEVDKDDWYTSSRVYSDERRMKNELTQFLEYYVEKYPRRKEFVTKIKIG